MLSGTYAHNQLHEETKRRKQEWAGTTATEPQDWALEQSNKNVKPTVTGNKTQAFKFSGGN